ncbi:YpjP-like protein [Bhargavaea ginsengi]|uniref:YpjP-like protein n=1 Tax=Bhargavaea ginsengi TaxID=426757 RepID=A0A1H6WU71_9BACL|nr:YpjP family protein [Bhargavaea ginsengi]SEJ15915.1 YpjP-like protein [Bhargavaea ginsengi]
MKKWIQKSLMAAVALVTLGFITPSHEIWDQLLDERGQKEIAGSTGTAVAAELPTTFTEVEDAPFSELAKATARDRAYEKFGSKIGPAISDEFDQVILPKIEEAIEITLVSIGDDGGRSLSISEQPAGGYSEKIFHIFDTESGKDLIRFHVRTDKRPLDGYYFNFHYHTSEDGYSRHIELGDIFWSKNTPPKWLS